MGGAVAVPGSDASCEDALNGTAVGGPEDAGVHVESLQTLGKEKMLLQSAGVHCDRG